MFFDMWPIYIRKRKSEEHMYMDVGYAFIGKKNNRRRVALYTFKRNKKNSRGDFYFNVIVRRKIYILE